MRVPYLQLLTGAVEFGIQCDQVGRDPVEIVGVIGADAELEQPPLRGGHDVELLAAVDGGEGVPGAVGGVLRWLQPEFRVVTAGGLHVGHPHRDRCQTVQTHRCCPLPRCVNALSFHSAFSI
jgi:hypothetical protein